MKVFIPIDVTKELPKNDGKYFILPDNILSSYVKIIDSHWFENEEYEIELYPAYWLKEVELVIPDDEEIEKENISPNGATSDYMERIIDGNKENARQNHIAIKITNHEQHIR